MFDLWLYEVLMSLFMIWFVIAVYSFITATLEGYSETFQGRSYNVVDILFDLLYSLFWFVFLIFAIYELSKESLRRNM